MMDNAPPLLYFHYVYRRIDFVRGCADILRKSVTWRLTEAALALALMLLLGGWWLGSDVLLAVLTLVLTGQLPLNSYLIAAAILLVTFFRADVFCWLICPWVFRRNAHANQPVYLSLDQDGVEGGTATLYTRVRWPAVRRLIVTRHLVIFVLSDREGLILPRRAIPSRETEQAALAFIHQAMRQR